MHTLVSAHQPVELHLQQTTWLCICPSASYGSGGKALIVSDLTTQPIVKTCFSTIKSLKMSTLFVYECNSPPSSESQYTSMVFFPCLVWNAVVGWDVAISSSRSTATHDIHMFWQKRSTAMNKSSIKELGYTRDVSIVGDVVVVELLVSSACSVEISNPKFTTVKGNFRKKNDKNYRIFLES